MTDNSHTLRLERLTPGTEIPGGKSTYVVEAYLGLGLTAHVYRARQEDGDMLVALKVLRADASQISTDHFWHEAQVLNELRNAGVTAIPQVIDIQREGDIQFLALEYLDRQEFQPLDELLESEPLPEQEALELAAQALELLDLLHIKVERTYTDMQLKDFRWNRQARTLKVIDWNHVSSRRQSIHQEELEGLGVQSFEDLIRQDTARFGAYFYRILTAKGAMANGETVRVLEDRAGERWGQISVAVRQVVMKALSTDPQRRYDSAIAFLHDVRQVQALWHEPLGDQVIGSLQDRLDAAKQAQPGDDHARIALDQVSAEMDMLKRRRVEVPLRLWKLLERATQGMSGEWSSGRLYYDAHQYNEATQKWEPEAHVQGRADLWRWVTLAQTGASEDGFETVRVDLEAVVKSLEANDIDTACRAFIQISKQAPWIKTAETQSLSLEIQAAKMVQLGREKETSSTKLGDVALLKEAVDFYRQADQVLQAIPSPYGDLLREEKGWVNLDEQADALERKWATSRQVSDQITKLEQTLEQDFEAGMAQLQTLLQQAPANQDLHVYCLEYASSSQTSHPERALEVVDAALIWGRPIPSIADDLRNVRDLITFDLWPPQIKEAARRGDGAKLRSLMLSIPEKSRQNEQFQILLTSLHQILDEHIEKDSLVAAVAVHNVLSPELNREDGQAYKERLETLKQRIGQGNQELENEHKDLLEKVQLETETLDELESKNAQAQEFEGWIAEKSLAWQDQIWQTSPEGYEEIIQSIDSALGEAEERFAHLHDEEFCQNWRHSTETQRDVWEKRQERWQLDQKGLAQAKQLIEEGIQAIGHLTDEQISCARDAFDQAQQALASVQEWNRAHRDELKDQAKYGLRLAESLEEAQVAMLVAKTRQALNQIDQLCRKDEIKSADQVLTNAARYLSRAEDRTRGEYWQQQLSYSAPLFPILGEMRKEVALWQKMLPFSGNGQDARGVLARLFDSLGGFKMLIAVVGWAAIITAIVVASLWMNSRLNALNNHIDALEERISGQVPDTEQIAQAPITPTLSPTPTIVPTSKPTDTPIPTVTLPPPPFEGVTLAWPENTLLYGIPPLTLTVQSGWSIVVDDDSLSVTDPERHTWSTEITVNDEAGHPLPQVGTLSVLTATTIPTTVVWHPPAESMLLPPGPYHLTLQATDSDGQVRETLAQTLDVTELYSATMTTSRIFDPGEAGMSVVYAITNTGNARDVLYFSHYPLKPSPTLGATGVLTKESTAYPFTLPLESPGFEFAETISVTYTTGETSETAILSGTLTFRLPTLQPGETVEIEIFVAGDGYNLPKSLFVFIPKAGSGDPIVIFEDFKE